MKICIVGKYPPIEGGVSTNTYWLARGLAERGHEIHVVTNADEVEPMFRLALPPEDGAEYQPRFGRSGGRVCVYNPAGFTRRAMTHIPEANPFVTKLASVATEVIRRHACEVVLTYYFEPYAVAGYLASRWTRRPLLVKHAGSDLERLLRVPDLATTYKEILRSADAVVTQPRLMPRFLGMRVERARLEPDVPYSVPTQVFHPTAEPLDLARAALRAADHDDVPRARPFDAALPTVGIYGKCGTFKGTYDLIAALGALVRDGRELNFVAMIGRSQASVIAKAVREHGLDERTYVLPLLPNWRVPRFLRACTAVCFLERDFPVTIHGPVIPREVLACGTCLVLSKEIATKQQHREMLRHGDNVVLVADPKDHAALAGALRSIVDDPAAAGRIGERGTLVSRAVENHEGYISGWERLLARYAAADQAAEIRQAPPSRSAALEAAIPELVSIIRRRRPALVEDFLRMLDAGDPVVAFCDLVIERLGGDGGADARRLLDATRYVRLRSMATRDPADGDAAAFPVSDRLGGQPVTRTSTWNLRPTRANAVTVAEFDHDVSALGFGAVRFQREGERDPEAALAGLAERRTTILFHRSVNLVPYEFVIDEPTRVLVAACDGSRTTAELLGHMHRQLGEPGAGLDDRLAKLVLEALDWLYREGLIVFGEYREGWGWTGGPRSAAADGV